MNEKKYRSIISHYESCLAKYGDTHLGVDWPKKEDVITRYKVMLDVIRSERPSGVTLLDFGCGTCHLYEHLLKTDSRDIKYSGLDISRKFIRLSRKKFPSIPLYCMDILDKGARLPKFDYTVMNGVFTEKRGLTFDEMFGYVKCVIKKVFGRTNIGLAFNVMSKHVDSERKDLFHLPFDALAEFLTKNVSRNFVFRNDYGLFEYTAYVYRKKNETVT